MTPQMLLESTLFLGKKGMWRKAHGWMCRMLNAASERKASQTADCHRRAKIRFGGVGADVFDPLTCGTCWTDIGPPARKSLRAAPAIRSRLREDVFMKLSW